MADFSSTADDYATWRAGFPEAFFERVFSQGWIAAGQRVLDLGTGTGTVARGLAARGCAVTGLDPSADMLAQAARLAREAGTDVTWRQATAEATGLPDDACDTIVAGQCWHWFDRPAALAECRRVLAPGGRLVIAHFDWLPLTGAGGAPNVVAATEALIRALSPDWALGGGTGLYPHFLPDLSAHAWREIETLSFDVDQPYSHEAWRGRIRASAGVGGSHDDATVAAFDRQLGEMLARDYPEDPLSIPHRVWIATAVA